MNNHLLLFTIGPVQSFIAQARKTQDLYAGSQILSALIKTGIDKFKKEFPSGEVIYPIFANDVDSLSLPNRFIGKTEDTAEKLKEKAKAIQLAVENEWQDIARRALRKANASAPTGFEDQVKAHLDIHWIYKGVTADFATAYQELEQLGGAVKNVRQFTQYNYGDIGEAGRKCSIEGKNNALFYRKNGTRRPAHLENAVELERFVLNPGEGLSAVSLVKRFYLEGKNKEAFPSTAEVALMHGEEQLAEEDKKGLDCYKKLFRKEKIVEACLEMFKNGWLQKAASIRPDEEEEWNDQFDYQMLFEENLNAKNIPNPKQLELLRQLHAKLKPNIKTKYYALVLFDGDKMGKWLAGENNKTKEDLESFHETLSGALSRFGSYARNYLNRENKNGHAVYSGGDDFLGFVNIHSLFEVMSHLREVFDDKVNKKIEAFKKEEKHLTFSAGILIAHYKTPFSEVLKKAREIERKAKKEGGRNAFGITVIKHSGEIQEAVYKWDAEKGSPNGCSNWIALEHIAKELDKEEGHFSPKFIQNLAAEFYQLTGADLYDFDTTNRDTRHLQNALTFEMKRLIGRAMDKRENSKIDKKRQDDLWDAVNTLWENALKPNKVQHFIHALQIADFLTRKTTQD